MSNESTPTYFARCKCGCGSMVAVTVDEPKFAKDTAQFVADLIKDGYTVERGTVGEARLSFGRAPNCTAK